MQPVTPFRIAATIATTLALALFAHPTMGAKRPAENISTGGACGAAINVIRWTPDQGPPARFVADTFMANGPELFIALGYAGDTFWSVEGYSPNDACDSCNQLDLVGTSLKNGRRSVSPLMSMKDHEDLDGKTDAEVHDHVLQKLWLLANRGAWPAEKLAQDYALRLPARDAQGVVEQDQGWLVEVGKPKQWRMLFDLDAHTEMCWCFYEWRPKKVAPR